MNTCKQLKNYSLNIENISKEKKKKKKKTPKGKSNQNLCWLVFPTFINNNSSM